MEILFVWLTFFSVLTVITLISEGLKWIKRRIDDH